MWPYDQPEIVYMCHFPSHNHTCVKNRKRAQRLNINVEIDLTFKVEYKNTCTWQDTYFGSISVNVEEEYLIIFRSAPKGNYVIQQFFVVYTTFFKYNVFCMHFSVATAQRIVF